MSYCRKVLAFALVAFLSLGTLSACSGRSDQSSNAIRDGTTIKQTAKSVSSGSSVQMNSNTIREGETSTMNSAVTNASSLPSKKPGSSSSSTPEVLTRKEFQFLTPGLPGSKSKELLTNPDRGLRLEVYVNASTGGWYPNYDQNRSAIKHTEEQLAMYAADKPQIAQTYVYLIDYYNRDLDQKALDNIQTYFDYLQSKGIRMLVRFAYEYDEKDTVRGPSTAQVLRHITQLKPLLEKNKKNIYALGAGFIGLWGEWHHALNIPDSDNKKILEAIIDATPKELFVLVRLVSQKNLLDKNDPRRARVGYEDLYLVGVKNSWNTGLVPGTDEWEQETSEAPFVITDGEMPWGTDTLFVNYVDPYLMAKRLNLHCFGTLSLVHHYKEGGGRYSMEKWKSEVTSAAKLSKEGLPFALAWFLDQHGKTMDRSMFAYIRDYLGYYLEVFEASAKIDGSHIHINATLKNYGFAAPNTMQQPELVVVDKNGKVVSFAAACRTVDLQTGKANLVTASLKLPADPYGAAVGIRFTNPRGTPARLANDIAFQNGINILGVLVN